MCCVGTTLFNTLPSVKFPLCLISKCAGMETIQQHACRHATGSNALGMLGRCSAAALLSPAAASVAHLVVAVAKPYHVLQQPPVGDVAAYVQALTDASLHILGSSNLQQAAQQQAQQQWCTAEVAHRQHACARRAGPCTTFAPSGHMPVPEQWLHTRAAYMLSMCVCCRHKLLALPQAACPEVLQYQLTTSASITASTVGDWQHWMYQW